MKYYKRGEGDLWLKGIKGLPNVMRNDMKKKKESAQNNEGKK